MPEEVISLRHPTARTLFLLLFWPVCLPGQAGASPPPNGPVYLLGKLSDADTVAITTAICTKDSDSIILCDSDRYARAVTDFLHKWGPREIHKAPGLVEVWLKLFPKAVKVVV